MTIAVAIKTERIIGNSPFVLLITDSRFTFPDGTYTDDGAKVFPLASQVWAVFSGDDAGVAERTLALVQRNLREQAEPLSFPSISQKLQQAVKSFYTENCRLNILVGAVGPGGDARILRVDHGRGPEVFEEPNQLAVIGHPTAQAAFLDEPIPEGPQHSLPNSPINGPALFLRSAQPYISKLANGLRHGGVTVGFPLQIMLITQFGEIALQLLSIGEGSPSLERISASPSEVRSWTTHESDRLRITPGYRVSRSVS